ncbi:MAG: hypothetical protein GC191_07935 [Azospirillum sp.]|nr:hypothetical protein [Azospirillum sp.]
MVGQPMPPQVVINSPNTPWRQGGAINKALGAACAAHEFNERVPMRYRAFFKDGVLGVAFGHGRNLVDPRGQADRRMIYLFLRADSTACIVIEVPNTDPNALQQNPQ